MVQDIIGKIIAPFNIQGIAQIGGFEIVNAMGGFV
jgi:hypothetical protein